MSDSKLGTSGSAPPFFDSSSIPNAPSIILEWVALIPLVIYLASANHSRRLIGRVALSDAISISFFPKLGVLGSVAKLMHEGPDFLDRACSIGESRREVWDVNWGSCFPCANGSVSELVFGSAIRRAGKPVPVLATPTYSSAPPKECKSSSVPHGRGREREQGKPAFTRPQMLHVIRCTRGHAQKHLSLYSTIVKWAYRVVTTAVLLATALVCCFAGMYGTMTAALISIAFQVAGLCIIVVHPSSYLGDNERGSVGSACMLVANHQNASTWYLFMGDRGVVDGVMNKNMIFSIESVFGRSLGTRSLILFLRLLSALQLLVLTFVAAQKGWDGIGLLIFIVLAWITDEIVHKDSWLVETWKTRHGIKLEARSFEFTGRVAMLGAIQVFKENPVSCWMDGIIVPSKRRDVWLKKLVENSGNNDHDEDINDEFDSEEQAQLGDDGIQWVRENLLRARTATKVMRMCFTQA